MTAPPADLPDEAFAVALLGLPALWPARLAALLGLRRPAAESGALALEVERWSRRPAAQAWELVGSGRAGSDPEVRRVLGPRVDAGELGATWAKVAANVDVAQVWERHRRSGVRVDLVGSSGYPPELGGDAVAPFVLFRTGGCCDLSGPRVAIVGTRRCTLQGADIAVEFGAELSRAGARIVSGLALGIDTAAHQGALSVSGSAPIGVVAGGFDVPYPARNRRLWQEVARAGVLVSEWPLGTRSEGWRFPARNRIIAALADAIVIVESRETGGSVITAEQGLGRDKPILAVPGSIRSPASAGTNRLLRDGAIPACSPDDVIALLELTQPSFSPARPDADARSEPTGAAGEVLFAVGWEPTPVEVILRRCALRRGEVTLQLAHLELDGWVRGAPGGWQRVAPPSR